MRNVNTRKNAGQLDRCSVTQLNTQHFTFLSKVNIVIKVNKKLNEKEVLEKQINYKKGREGEKEKSVLKKYEKKTRKIKTRLERD